MKKSTTVVPALFLVLFIDGMGLSLLFPILNSIIVDPSISFLPKQISPGQRDFLYGLIISVFMLCWFFGAAILGDISDNIGRKKSLLLCLIGSFIGYFISAVAIVVHSLILLFVGRIIAGFTAGSQPIAQAAIIDVSTEENKTRNIGFILLAISLGFVGGPILGAILSNHQLAGWFNFSTPLFFAALLSLLNALMLAIFFQETATSNARLHFKLSKAIQVFISAFKHSEIRKLSIILFIMILGWSDYFSFVAMFLFKKFHYTPLQINLFMAWLGIWSGIGFAFLINLLVRFYNLKTIVIGGFLITGISVFVTAISSSMVAWIAMIPIGLGLSCSYSAIITIFSNQVEKEEQGWVMGVTGSIMALCFGVSCLLTGFLVPLSPALPLKLGAISLIISAMGMFYIRKEID